MPEPIYRTAYVTHNSGHDFRELLRVCKEIKFITSGYEAEENLLDAIIKGLENFNPEVDIVVPVGNVPINLLAGLVLNRMCFLHGSFTMAIYQAKEYHMRVVEVPGYVIIPKEVINDNKG